MPFAFFVLQYPFPWNHVASVNLLFKPDMKTAIILRRVIVCRAPWFFPAFFQIRSSTYWGNAVLEMVPPTFWMTDLTPTIVVWCVEPSHHTIEQFLDSDHIITLLQGVYDVSHMSEEFRGHRQTVDRWWRYWQTMRYHAPWQHDNMHVPITRSLSFAKLPFTFSRFGVYLLLWFFFVIIKHISNLHNPIKPGLEDLFIPLSKFIERHFCQFAKVSVKNWPL